MGRVILYNVVYFHSIFSQQQEDAKEHYEEHWETVVAPVEVPEEFLKPADSPRDPREGKPADVFRYDLVWEFCSAISEGRDAMPSFDHGLNAQIIADAVLESNENASWIDVADRLV